MKKIKKSKGLQTQKIKNPVAKFAFQFNKVQVFKDKSKYQRRVKHNNREPYPILSSDCIEYGFCLI